MKSLGLAALFSLELAIHAFAATPAELNVRFAELRKSPPELYQFLLRMPKGGDLHNHVSGAVYAESYIRVAAEDKLCADLHKLAFAAPASNGCGENQIEAAHVAADNTLRNKFIDSFSMRNFVPSAAESGHDHFFATFGKFGPYKKEHHGEFIAEIVRRAAMQNESYLELMAINGAAANAIAPSIGKLDLFDSARNALMNAGLPKVVDAMRARVEESDQASRRLLFCDSKPSDPACLVTVRYLLEVLRESSPEQVFAQTLAGFMLASSYPKIVGVNFVQPEDGIVSIRDYHRQMEIIGYCKKLYPTVHVTLHAGELTTGLVPPDDLRFHVREAVEIGQAERIGHGVDVMYEFSANQLLDEMKQRHVMVEINLTSNDLILGVRGAAHPFPVYRKHGVPVALSTDDEGVARGHLTDEYLRAARDYSLSYSEMKDIVRNSLEYSFLPGPATGRTDRFNRRRASASLARKHQLVKNISSPAKKPARSSTLNIASKLSKRACNEARSGVRANPSARRHDQLARLSRTRSPGRWRRQSSHLLERRCERRRSAQYQMVHADSWARAFQPRHLG
jgi:adenosine deaminase